MIEKVVLCVVTLLAMLCTADTKHSIGVRDNKYSAIADNITSKGRKIITKTRHEC